MGRATAKISVNTNLHSDVVISGERCSTQRGQAQGTVPTRLSNFPSSWLSLTFDDAGCLLADELFPCGSKSAVALDTTIEKDLNHQK